MAGPPKYYKDKPGPGYVLEQGHGWYLPEGATGGDTEEVTPEKKAAEKAEQEKLGPGSPMPKSKDFPTMDDFMRAMRIWRAQNLKAKDAAGAIANRPK